ncbi:hypothetical protein [Catellatospora citrea]|uniref:Uncharacterized protein n=1 Tax=Catellatospora citrea TaxID=53366 RepID=A0A8J3KAA1_9ACTN|nr:hypothetical protein [Catellatospora citrea]RKE12583.1 hypothetical protein C8E86_7525 [Catellatospora citrea]GIF96181.1 hypothetical protein Cci01nite_12750 [Catellatospora citrea]
MSVWAVLEEADRPRWTYTPGVGVGPLVFGMSRHEAVAAMDGFVGDLAPAPRAIADTWLTRFRVPDRLPYRTAVLAFHDGTDGLFCVIVDAACGPQVTLDGLRLVGRLPSGWEAELFDYALPRGIQPVYAPTGDPGADELGIIMQVQRAGDHVLTRPALGVVRERANTLWDSLPYDPDLHG